MPAPTINPGAWRIKAADADPRAAAISLSAGPRASQRTRTALEHESVGHDLGAVIDWQQHVTNRSLGSGEVHVSTFTASADDEAELEEIEVEPMFSYEVPIDGRPISYLTGFVHDIYPVLYECGTGQPLSIFAPHPL